MARKILILLLLSGITALFSQSNPFLASGNDGTKVEPENPGHSPCCPEAFKSRLRPHISSAEETSAQYLILPRKSIVRGRSRSPVGGCRPRLPLRIHSRPRSGAPENGTPGILPRRKSPSRRRNRHGYPPGPCPCRKRPDTGGGIFLAGGQFNAYLHKPGGAVPLPGHIRHNKPAGYLDACTGNPGVPRPQSHRFRALRQCRYRRDYPLGTGTLSRGFRP